MSLSTKLKRTPQAVKHRVRTLYTAADVADLLELPLGQLNFILFTGRHRYPYSRFSIPKRSGGTRTIARPPKSIAILQKKLTTALQLIYRPRTSVHGFVPKRSIATNARLHAGKRFVFNIDLVDFFSAINFGRVRGMLLAPPYQIGPPAATVLAQLACDRGHLPQGAPSSPIISNMVCGRLDSELTRLARQFRCHYSRYADDITLSTDRRRFPAPLAQQVEDADGGAERQACMAAVGPALQKLVEGNGFQVNSAKVRLQHSGTRQEVTGVIVNRHPNTYRRHVRQVRAMIHAIEKFGPDKAAKEFAVKYDPQQRPASTSLFRSVVLGKLEFVRMIKGDADGVYRRLVNSLHNARPTWIDEVVPDAAPELDKDWRYWKTEWQRRVFHVEVETTEGDIQAGSAVRLGRTRFLTSKHVVEKMKSVCLILPGGTKSEPSVRLHPGVDAALLFATLPKTLRSVPPSRRLSLPAPGTQVAALGFPSVPLRKPELTMTPGYVEATALDYYGQRSIQVSMHLAGGNSGGPVIDRGGNLIGIVMELTTSEGTEVAARPFHQVLPLAEIGDFLDSPTPNEDKTRIE